MLHWNSSALKKFPQMLICLLASVSAVSRGVSLSKLYNIRESLFENHLKTAVRIQGDGHVFTLRDFSKKIGNFSQTALVVDRCSFIHCSDYTGGAIMTEIVAARINHNYFAGNQAVVGGAGHHLRSINLVKVGNTYVSNFADYDGAFTADSIMDKKNDIDISDCNLTSNTAKLWSGGARIDCVGGLIIGCIFESNSAKVNGAFFDFSWAPSQRNVTMTIFRNNSAVARGGAFCAFHIQHHSVFDNVIFTKNTCEQGANSISIESIDSEVVLYDVSFDGKQEDELGMRFGESEFKTTTKTRFQVKEKDMRKGCDRMVKAYKNRIKIDNKLFVR